MVLRILWQLYNRTNLLRLSDRGGEGILNYLATEETTSPASRHWRRLRGCPLMMRSRDWSHGWEAWGSSLSQDGPRASWRQRIENHATPEKGLVAPSEARSHLAAEARVYKGQVIEDDSSDQANFKGVWQISRPIDTKKTRRRERGLNITRPDLFRSQEGAHPYTPCCSSPFPLDPIPSAYHLTEETWRNQRYIERQESVLIQHM
ncbi:hypothetical protein DL93DRAFT_2097063 [Clavulina sp. PMI_390]|nr:hypothetical protein DL93DRAFT_2097063 [Clavulina sp. PMI_390]